MNAAYLKPNVVVLKRLIRLFINVFHGLLFETFAFFLSQTQHDDVQD